ncbi:MAG: prolipoprotein diacylglyceryl transferase [Clostridia bacterium]|nr:prolipoprotein diacylglyceryl transferase [Clostridia bacterium]
MNRIQFPGLGLDFTVNETAFSIFGIDIKWYGVIITTGILLAFLLFYRYAVKKEGIDPDSIYNVTLLVMPVGIIGARFVYVATEWERFKGTGFLNIINIRQGGIAIYGAIIFGLVAVLIHNKIKKLNSLSMLDALAPAVMLGQAIGRWGNFVNAEAYGWSEGVDKLPWRMVLDYYVIDGKKNPVGVNCVHPTFIYESLWNILGLAIILFILYRKKKFNGEIFFAYLGWYGLGRAYIETLRADSLYIVGNLKFSVFVGIVCVIAAIIGELVLYSRHRTERGEMEEYTSAYATVKIATSNEEDALDQSVFDTENDVSDDSEESEELEDIGDYDEETLAEQDMLDGDPDDIDEEEEEQ